MRYYRFAIMLTVVAAACSGGSGDNQTAEALAEAEAALEQAQSDLEEAEAALADQQAAQDGLQPANADDRKATGMHVAGYETRSVNRGNTWRAEVTVTAVDTLGDPVADVEITGTWDEGDVESATCTTSQEGTCTLESDHIRKRIAWIGLELTSIVHPTLPFLEADDYNPAGLEISIRKP